MGRIRSIKPEFPQSETIGALSRDARLCFVMLWTILDDEGRTRAASRMLASLLYPYDDDAARLMDGWLDELERAGCIRRYEVDGHRYLDVPKWLEHQKIDKPTKSKLPEFVETSRALAKPREPSTTDMDKDLGSRKRNTDSVANAPESAAPSAPTEERSSEATPVEFDPAKQIFAEELRWLMRAGGKSEASTRTWLGKCVRDFGPHTTLAACIQIRGSPSPPIDPFGAIQAILRGKRHGRSGKAADALSTSDVRRAILRGLDLDVDGGDADPGIDGEAIAIGHR